MIDTTGAGDAFVAMLVTGLALGRGPARSGQGPAAAATQTVTHLGGRPRLGLPPTRPGMNGEAPEASAT